MKRRMCRIGAGACVLLLVVALPVHSQGILRTVAGAPWVFAGNNGPAVNATLGWANGVALDAAGNVYASDSGNQIVVKITPGGTLTIVAGNGNCCDGGDGGPATLARMNNPTGLAFDAAGNLYIADSSNSRIRKVTSNGIISTVAGTGKWGFSGDGGPALGADMRAPSGIAFDSAGNMYIAEAANHRIRKVDTSGIITTIAGDGFGADANGRYAGDGGPATLASLNSPRGLSWDAAGNLYVADSDNNVIRKISGGTITTFAGTRNCCSGGDGGPATLAWIANTTDITFDAGGNAYIASSGNWRVYKVTTDGTINTVAGGGTLGDGGPATGALIWGPAGVRVDTAGNIYIADSGNYRVRKVNAAGTISTIAGNGMYRFGGDGGPATAAQLNGLTGVTLDAAGNLYIADNGNHRVRKVTPAGIISTVAGTSYCCDTGDGGPATAASFNQISAVAADASGNVYIADSWNRVRKVSAAGIITAFAGTGDNNFAGDGGPATLASFRNPNGLAFDGAGNLYITDLNNNRVRKVGLDGNISTVAGNGTSGYSGDGGQATFASLNQPWQVTVDAKGNLYIGELAGSRVRKVTPAGIITTYAGTGQSGYSGDGWLATAAMISGATGLVADLAGNLYIADNANSVIRRVSPDGIITTVAGPCCSDSDGVPATLAHLSGGNKQLTIDFAGRIYFTDNWAGITRIRMFATGDGFVYAGNATATPAGTARVPLILTMNGNASVDSISLSVSVTPNGTAPVLASALGFESAPGLPSPSLMDTGGGAGIISVSLTGLAASIQNAKLGDVVVSLPGSGSLSFGQSYSVQVLGAGGSLNNTPVTLGPGTAGTVTAVRGYLVGDVAPYSGNDAGTFGDSSLNNVDLITALRAVTKVPGYVPSGCSDRFDAMDSFPAEAPGARGGDGFLTNMDLIITLRRVTGVDTSRPQRISRLACTLDRTIGAQTTALSGGGAAPELQWGQPVMLRETVRIPVYLYAPARVDLAGLSYSLAATGAAHLRFVADGGSSPTLLDTGLPNIVSAAWLSSLTLAPRDRLLLGTLEVTGADSAEEAIAMLRVHGIAASSSSGASISVVGPGPGSNGRRAR